MYTSTETQAHTFADRKFTRSDITFSDGKVARCIASPSMKSASLNETNSGRTEEDQRAILRLKRIYSETKIPMYGKYFKAKWSSRPKKVTRPG